MYIFSALMLCMPLGALTNSKQLQNKSLEQVPKQNDVISFRLVVFVLSVCFSSRGRTESPNKTRLQTTFERPGVTEGSRCYALLNLSTLSLTLPLSRRPRPRPLTIKRTLDECPHTSCNGLPLVSLLHLSPPAVHH